MPTLVRHVLRWRPQQNLLVLFVLTILLPGIVLAIAGVRALVQERRFAEEDAQKRLDRVAEVAAQNLDRELRSWQAMFDAASRAETTEAVTLPDWMRQAGTEPGVAALVAFGPARPRIWPARALAYEPWIEPGPDVTLASALADAETVEVRDKDYVRAIELYRQLLQRGGHRDQAWLLHHLARTYRKAGQWDESLRVFQQLASRSTDRVGELPADLISRYELSAHYAARGPADRLTASARDLYRDLVNGVWPIDQTSYPYYADTTRAWATGGRAPSGEMARLVVVDSNKRRLAEAVTAGADTDAYLVLHRPAGGDHPRAAVFAVDKNWLRDHLWPDTLAVAGGEGLDVALVTSTGEALFSPAHSGPGPVASRSLVDSRILQASGRSWRVDVRARDPAALSAGLARRQRVLFAVLVGVVALLVSGTYLTTRVVRRELEIAQMKSDFVSAVSHDFRSPLTGIRQLGEMLMRGRVPSEERRQEYYERITHESDRLTRIVENLLDFSRMDAGRKQYHFQAIDAAGWLRGVAAQFESQVLQHGHSLVATIPSTLPALVADPEALTTAVENLLDNAAKYSPDSATMWLDADAKDDELTIRVRDRGVGIAERDRPHVFERFYRGTGEMARQVKGSGLGLSLVQLIVRAHGGRVECQSRPGEGTTFSIHLKTVPGNEAEPRHGSALLHRSI